MTDAQRQAAIAAFERIHMGCANLITHGVSGSPVPEDELGRIIQDMARSSRIGIEATKPAPDEAESVARLQKTMAEVSAWIEDDESAPRVEDAIHRVTSLMLRLHDGVKALGLAEETT
jgi:hypothetical protein